MGVYSQSTVPVQGWLTWGALICQEYDMRKTAEELLGIPDPPKNGRERLILKAIDLFYTHGFNAVGVDQIIDAAGVTKTTFYKHFESKDELMVAAVKRRDEWESAAWGRAIRAVAGDDPR